MSAYPPILESVFADLAPDADSIVDVYGRSTPVVSLRYSELVEMANDYRIDGLPALVTGFTVR